MLDVSYILVQSKLFPDPSSSPKPHCGPETAKYPCILNTSYGSLHGTVSATPRKCDPVQWWTDRYVTWPCALAPTAGCICTAGHACLMFIPEWEDNDREVTAEGAGEYACPLPLPLPQPPHWMDRLPVQHALLHRLHGPGNRHVCAHSPTSASIFSQYLWSFWASLEDGADTVRVSERHLRS